MVHGKRVKEWFQIVYDYRLQEWAYNYRRGMSGLDTFAGYREGTKFTGETFPALETLDDMSLKVVNFGSPEPPIVTPEPEPEPDPPPVVTHPPVGTWQTTYEWRDINYRYRIQRDKN